MTERTRCCEQCSNPFTFIRSTKRFCSVACLRESERCHLVRCSWCDKPCTKRSCDLKQFTISFCGKSCAARFRSCVTQGFNQSAWPRTKTCMDCGREYPSASSKPSRCPECRAALKAQLIEVACIDCGAIELGALNRKRCPQCKKLETRKRKKAKKDNRHLKRRAYVFERDKGRCLACKRKVVTGNHLHPRAAEIDHIIPRSLWPVGVPGVNAPANLRLLCRTCNAEKSNGTVPGGDQLLLLG